MTEISTNWYVQLLHRACRLFWLKGIGTTAFMTLFFIAYFHLLRHPAFAITEMPYTAFDRAIAFQAWALLPYATLWVYVSLPPLFAADLPRLLYYGVVVGLVCVFGLTCFYFWPTATPPFAVDTVAHPSFAFLKTVDTSGNACPSLHVGVAVFSAFWLAVLLREVGAPRYVNVINVAWCVLIVYSTLATKQHVFVDALSGFVLGAVAAWISLHYRPKEQA